MRLSPIPSAGPSRGPNHHSRRFISRHSALLTGLVLMAALAAIVRGPITGAAGPNFTPKVDFGTGASPNSVTVGDLNRSAKLSLTVANFGSNTVSVPPSSTTYTVNSTADTNDSVCNSTNCTLREAINAANSNSGADTIVFGVSGTVTLGSSLPTITDDLTIDGAGQSITIDGVNSFQVLIIQENCSLKHLTIINGRQPQDLSCGVCGGGAIALIQATLNISNSTFSNNSSNHFGGAILAFNGALVITDSTFSNNSAHDDGGAIFSGLGSFSLLSITNSTFLGNSTQSDGGAISTDSDTSISNSTFGGNTADSGGAISTNEGFASNGRLNLSNSTLSSNSAKSGGAIDNTGKTSVTHTLFALNTAQLGGAIVNSDTLTLNDNFFWINSADAGGAIANALDTVEVANCTFWQNRSNAGAAIWNFANVMHVTNSTFSDNSRNCLTPGCSAGGAILNSETLTLTNSTLSGNAADFGGGLAAFTGTATLKNTIIANSPSGGDCYRNSGTVDGKNTLIFDSSNACGLTNGTNGNVIGFDPLLDVLTNNGGFTTTFALLSGSPAIEHGTDVTTLNGAIDNAVTSITLTDANAFPAGVGFAIKIDNEQMIITAKASNTLTVTRAANGTAAAAHSNGAAVNPAFDQRGKPRRIGSVLDIGSYESGPTVSASGPATFCAGGSVTLSSNSASGNQWYLNGNLIDGATNQQYVATASGNYTVVVTVDGVSSDPSAAVTVTVNSFPATPTINGATNGTGTQDQACPEQPLTLTATSAGATSYQWYQDGSPLSGETSSTLNVTGAGTFTVTATANGCTTAQSAGYVVQNPSPHKPVLSAGGPTTFCQGGSVTLMSDSATGIQWYKDGVAIPGANSQNYIATASGSYNAQLNALGCHSQFGDPITVTILQNDVTVTNSNDSGAGSLRDAILAACPAATITFDPALTSGGPATVALTTGELLIDKNLTITGPGANLLSIARVSALETSQFRVFQIASGSTVNISGLTITNGRTAPGAEDSDEGSGGVGGGILNNPGATLTLKSVAIKGNQTGPGNSAGGVGGSGGGLANFGTLNIVNSTISGNRTGDGGAGISGAGNGGDGGGISNAGTMTIVNTTISGNQTGAGGNSTAGGTQGGDGGGIANAGTLTLTNSTISANQTGAGGAGASGGDGGGISAGDRSTTTVKNSIVAANSVFAGGNGPDFSGVLNSEDFNLIGSDSGASISGTTTHNIINQSANLSSLANHGGPTETMLPLIGSPAINAGDNGTSLPQDSLDGDNDANTAETLPVDQRGFARLVDDEFDIGAVETNYLITTTGGSAQSTVINTAFALPLKATVKESGINQAGVPVTFTPPASGPSGSFSGPTTVNTDGSGVATSPTFTANSIGGTYNVVASLAGGLASAPFALTNTPANQTITFNPNALPNKTFGDPDFDVSATASSGLTVTFTPTGNCTMSGNTVHLTGAGSCTITASQSGNASFNPAPNVVRSFSIAKANQTINFGALADKQLGDPDFAVSANATSGLTVSFTAAGQCTITGNTVHITGPGSCTVTAAQAGDMNFNAAPSVPQTFAITNPALFSFSQSNYSVNESAGFVTITVNRGGDLSTAVSVDYATSDTGALNDCSVLKSALASDRCDFGLTLGTVHFAASETQKTFVIPITQDAYTEGPEAFTVNLSNAVGSEVGLRAPSSAIVTINDSTAATPNAIDDTETFVRQQYRDFLNRDADPNGLAFWASEIDNCTPKPQCTELKRINVSAAFFLSIEFQTTGNLVRSVYVAALNRPATNGMPEFIEFERDTQALQRGVIVDPNNNGWQVVLANNVDAFVKDFVMRPEFVGLYPTTDTPAQYVDKLYLHAQITPTTEERNKAISEFGTATTASDPEARGRALLDVTENTGFQAREKNPAFVQMQYFGYLRRNPNEAPDNDFSGFNFWLNKLNAFNGNFVDAEMVEAFLSSGEYRHRFGP